MLEADRGPSPFCRLCFVANLLKGWRRTTLEADKSPWLRQFGKYQCLKLTESSIETIWRIWTLEAYIRFGEYRCLKLTESLIETHTVGIELPRKSCTHLYKYHQYVPTVSNFHTFSTKVEHGNFPQSLCLFSTHTWDVLKAHHLEYYTTTCAKLR